MTERKYAVKAMDYWIICVIVLWKPKVDSLSLSG